MAPNGIKCALISTIHLLHEYRCQAHTKFKLQILLLWWSKTNVPCHGTVKKGWGEEEEATTEIMIMWRQTFGTVSGSSNTEMRAHFIMGDVMSGFWWNITFSFNLMCASQRSKMHSHLQIVFFGPAVGVNSPPKVNAEISMCVVFDELSLFWRIFPVSHCTRASSRPLGTSCTCGELQPLRCCRESAPR